VWLITDSRPDTLRIKKGPFISGPGAQQVFVVGDGEAVRTEVTIGVAGIDHWEVVSGLSEGQRVIISSMDEHLHLASIRIR
jgi:HlyD family secretion protein